jgi:hypothetical protein
VFAPFFALFLGFPLPSLLSPESNLSPALRTAPEPGGIIGAARIGGPVIQLVGAVEHFCGGSTPHAITFL